MTRGVDSGHVTPTSQSSALFSVGSSLEYQGENDRIDEGKAPLEMPKPTKKEKVCCILGSFEDIDVCLPVEICL